MAIVVYQVAVGGFDKNFSYLIAETDSRQAYVVDPSGDFLKVSAQIEVFNYRIVGILLTHTHQDHFDKLEIARAQYPVHIYVHEHGVLEVARYGNLHVVCDGMTIPLVSTSISVIHTPGHTDDSVCFYIAATDANNNVPLLITGDTLFVGGCGRTNELRVKDLYESLAELAALPEETIIFPGHDYGSTPTSTIGFEKKHNKYYQVANFSDFQRLRLG